MINSSVERRLVLAVFPSTRGFGYVVFEGPHSPIDWGVKRVKGDKNAGSLKKISELFEFYRPETLVLEDYRGEGSRRAGRIERLIDAAAELAQRERIETRTHSREEIRRCFAGSGVVNKHEIAQAIAREFPELGVHLPPERKIWMSEDPRMSIFDAAALSLTFFRTTHQTKRAA